jgi:hypothetical protein
MKRRQVLAGAGGLGVAAVAGVVGWELFAPETATQLEETDSPAGEGELLKQGEWVGKDGYDVSGTVALLATGDGDGDGGGHALRFRDYRQTQGPDVFIYVTPAEDPDTAEAIAEGTKVLLDGGADGGESTLEGDFTQALPESVDPAGINGVAAWCDRFSVPFGAATLSEA